MYSRRPFEIRTRIFWDQTCVEIVWDCCCYSWLKRFYRCSRSRQNIVAYLSESSCTYAFVVALTAKKASREQNRGLPTEKKSNPRVTHGTHTRVTHETRQYNSSSGKIFTEIDKDVPKKGLNSRPRSAAHENRTAAAAAAAAAGLLYLVAAFMYHTTAETPSFADRRVRLKSNSKHRNTAGSHGNTARKNHRTRVMLLPALLAGDSRV